MPALVKKVGDRDSLLFGLVENVAREQLSPVEEARAYASLVVAWGMTPLGALTTGFLLQSFGAVRTLLILAGVSAGLAACATAIRAVRSAPRLESLSASSPP